VGLSGDLILLDELREHQSWDAWGAITKTTMARAMALILALSNAGDATSIVLRYLRKMAHAALGDPDGINADDPAALLPETTTSRRPRDRRGRLGRRSSSGRPLPAATSGTGTAGRRRTRRWATRSPSAPSPPPPHRPGVDLPHRGLVPVVGGHARGSVPARFVGGVGRRESKRADGAEIALCVDVSWDRSTSPHRPGLHRADGNLHVEVIASRTGTEWVKDWLTDERAFRGGPSAPVAVQAKGAPASSLITGSQRRSASTSSRGAAPTWAPARARSTTSSAPLSVRARETGVRHRSQPILNIAAANAATKPAGDAWWWDRRKSPVDVAPLIAVTGAAWCLTSAMPETPGPSAYEERGLEVV
jgi:hypothetical protein